MPLGPDHPIEAMGLPKCTQYSNNGSMETPHRLIKFHKSLPSFIKLDDPKNLGFIEQWVNAIERFMQVMFVAQKNDPELYRNYYQLLLVFLDAGMVSVYCDLRIVGKHDSPNLTDLCHRALSVQILA
ncbi:hypothetical protein FRC03_001666 [Tulasnella sp. 419]|nr:hypothetical protein FRC03_001666 [Tulasnella sp. 419]